MACVLLHFCQITTYERDTFPCNSAINYLHSFCTKYRYFRHAKDARQYDAGRNEWYASWNGGQNEGLRYDDEWQSDGHEKRATHTADSANDLVQRHHHNARWYSENG